MIDRGDNMSGTGPKIVWEKDVLLSFRNNEQCQKVPEGMMYIPGVTQFYNVGTPDNGAEPMTEDARDSNIDQTIRKNRLK
jgi:hypothetical protein